MNARAGGCLCETRRSNVAQRIRMTNAAGLQEPGERSGAESYRAELVIPAGRRWLSCILPNENSEGGVSCPLRKTSSYSKFDNSFETQVNFAIITSC